MSTPDSSVSKIPFPLHPLDIKRICVVFFEDNPLVEGHIPSHVQVKALHEDRPLPLPHNQVLLKIEGEWFKQLSNDNAEEFHLGDEINIIFGRKDNEIRWLERRDKSQPDSALNKIFN